MRVGEVVLRNRGAMLVPGDDEAKISADESHNAGFVVHDDGEADEGGALQVDPDDRTSQRLAVISQAFFAAFSIRSLAPARTEYLYYSTRDFERDFPPTKKRRRSPHYGLLINQWNLFWEAGEFRGEIYEKMGGQRLPPRLVPLTQDDNRRDVILLPRFGEGRGAAWAPFFHMLPPKVIAEHGLPQLEGCGFWPWNGFGCMEGGTGRASKSDYQDMTSDFDRKLARAFASYIWPLLSPASPMNAFSKSSSLVLLAHNLDHWLPYLDRVLRQRLEGRIGRIPGEAVVNPDSADYAQMLTGLPAQVLMPHYGGDLWAGEADAWSAAREMVEEADHGGGLRAIVDAFRSHRVVDDFSDRWSKAKEDFERKLYSKRSKIKVSFVELDDKIPVVSGASELTDNLLWDDVMSILDPKEREVVILLRSGETRLADVAESLGYSGHSAISKKLAKVRAKVARYLS